MPDASQRITSALTLGGFLIACGSSVMVHELMMASQEHPVTGVVQSCVQVHEAGFSAPSLPAEADRYGYRCLVEISTSSGLAQITYDTSDPITRQLERGATVNIISASVGSWHRFRPAGYARNLGILQFGLLLFGCGLVLRRLGATSR